MDFRNYNNPTFTSLSGEEGRVESRRESQLWAGDSTSTLSNSVFSSSFSSRESSTTVPTIALENKNSINLYARPRAVCASLYHDRTLIHSPMIALEIK